MSDLPITEAVLGAFVAAVAALVARAATRRSLGLGLFVVFAAVVLIGRDRLDADALDRVPGRVAAVALVAFVVAVAGTATLRTHALRSRGVVLWAAGSAGVFVSVPDTEAIAVVTAGLGVMALVTLVRGEVTVSPVALAGAGLLVLAAAAVGAVGRPAAIAGVVAAVSPTVTGPLVEGLVARGRAERRLAVVPAGALTLAVALTVGRISGVDEGWGEAIGPAVVVAGIGVVVWAAALGVRAFTTR